MTSGEHFHSLDLSRRTFLRRASLAACIGASLGLGLAGDATAATKFSQKMAKYQPTPHGAQRCDNCSQFVPPTDCKVVDGPISPAGWCMLYVHK